MTVGAFHGFDDHLTGRGSFADGLLTLLGE